MTEIRKSNLFFPPCVSLGFAGAVSLKSISLHLPILPGKGMFLCIGAARYSHVLGAFRLGLSILPGDSFKFILFFPFE